MPLAASKIKASKLCKRVRQFARNTAVAECYEKVLNPVNVAAFFKYREGLRRLAGTDGPPQTSFGTRDALVEAWRDQNPTRALPPCAPSCPHAAALPSVPCAVGNDLSCCHQTR